MSSDLSRGLQDAQVASFVNQLRVSGYAERTIRKRRSVATAFARWAKRKKLALADLDESQVTKFLGRSHRPSKHRIALERASVRLFLRHLRPDAERPDPPAQATSPLADELARYVSYLRTERGLAENSILVYSPFIKNFLTDRVARNGALSLRTLDGSAVKDFLLDRLRGRSSEWSRLLATALRSFLRFLFLRGETAFDLSRALPTVRRWRQAEVPTFLSSDDVEGVLSGTDRANSRGRRDYAILLLLARLGLRAGEVQTLEISDIRWRTGEIVIHGKGRTVDRLPLLSDVGEALARYLQDRGVSASRRVFLRTIAPHVGLAGPAAIGHVVRVALARVGISRSSRGAAHIFRHSLATKMIHQGASIPEIAEVLRHRSQNTTEIYAKVDFEALRGVARSWPGTGGVR
jgi:integrase/recombinase XerD